MAQLTMIAYCREGFERECLQELESVAQENGLIFKSPREVEQGFVVFEVSGIDNEKASSIFSVSLLVYARQVVFCLRHFRDCQTDDRVKLVMEALNLSEEGLDQRLFSGLYLEYPETNQGKKISKFCKKFEIPLSNKLKKTGYKQVYRKSTFPGIHLFFISYTEFYVCLSYPPYASSLHLGIKRLKFPRLAPSRSTLKLEEAFYSFLTTQQQEKFLRPNSTAVDLGASPGGWTFQLVQRGIRVQSIDNGPMDEYLMNSGLVEHKKEDAFKFVPDKRVDWMVCDVVEQPLKSASLLLKWLSLGYCRFAIVNLKLPMKRRFEMTKQCLDLIKKGMDSQSKLTLKGKQLFHDREEITIFATFESMND